MAFSRLKSAKVYYILTLLILITQVNQSLANERDERKAIPGVVNPAIRSEMQQFISLDGVWDFATDPHLIGENEKWYLPDKILPDKRQILVPGCWEAQGVGKEGLSHGLDYSKSRVYEPVIVKLRNAYTGPGWYKKKIMIPDGWEGKQVWLKIGAVNAQGWIWVNGNYVAHNYVYCANYKYNVTDLVVPGQETDITVLVRNDVNSRRGESQCIRVYGGLTRSVELEVTEDVLIDDAYVIGMLDQKQSQVVVTLRNTSAKAMNGRDELDIKVSTYKDNRLVGSATQRIESFENETDELTVNVDMADCVGWTPEKPFLYKAEIVLKRDDMAIGGWAERYGVRKIEVRGGDIYLNNERFFMRGAGDDHVYPITVCSPPSRDTHKQHLSMAKKYGFNYIRHHTHCEIPEFYEAADEVGIVVQPELPFANGNHMSFGPVRLEEDLIELITHYRRYTSLMTYCSGSESNHGKKLSERLYQLAKKTDPTRLFLHQDSLSQGGVNRPGNSDMDVRCIRQVHLPDGRTDFPQSEHEFMSFGLDKDPRLEKKYTGGYLPAETLAQAKAYVAQLGIDWKWADACYKSGHRLQSIHHKIGIESVRLDPYQDGFNTWLMVDITPNSQNGVLDAFWEPKLSTPEYFRQFNSPVMILARSPNPQPGKTLSAFKDFPDSYDYSDAVRPMGPRPANCGNETRVFASGEILEIAWVISNFGHEDISNEKLSWTLSTGVKKFASGEIKGVKVKQGEVPIAGNTKITMPAVTKPLKAKLQVKLSSVQAVNSWDVWIFPVLKPQPGAGLAATKPVYETIAERYPGISILGSPQATEAKVIICKSIYEEGIIEALEQGKKVIACSLPGFDLLNAGTRLGWWGTTNQTGTAIARHPAFGDYPNEGYLDQAWFRLVSKAEKLDPGHNYKTVEPLMIGSGRILSVNPGEATAKFGYNLYTFQAVAGNGKLLATELKLLSDLPEAAYLLDQFIKYAKSDKFRPKGEFDISMQDILIQAAKIKEKEALAREFNGWSATLEVPKGVEYPSFLGKLKMNIIRQTDGKGQLRWKTNKWIYDQTNSVSFKWIANTGWVTEPAGGYFTLYLGDKKLLDFDLAMKTTTWKSENNKVTLHYEVKGFADKAREDSNGIMTLTLPQTMLNVTGDPMELKVTGSASGSKRFFGLYEYPIH